MHVNLEIPDDLAQRLSTVGGNDLSRRALEGFGLEEYKAGRLSKAELRRLLGFESRYEIDGFLKAHNAWDDVTIDDLRQDLRDLETLGL
jgi:hypothetical protein